MRILGISAFYHDSAAALVENGTIIAAAQEERFTRRKGDNTFPENAIRYCLDQAGLNTSDLDAAVYYDKPVITFERLVSSQLHAAPRGLRSFLKSMPSWLNQKLWMESTIRDHLADVGDVLFSKHHLSHAASAFFPSPFEHAAVATMDGVGEWETTTIGRGDGNSIHLLKAIHFPDSLGLFYSAFTNYCGFRVNSGEYKLMGLAPYGKPAFAGLIKRELIHLAEDGSFTLNQRYFDYIGGPRMINKRFERLFGRPSLPLDHPPTQFHMDIAASAQRILEEIVVAIARHTKKITGDNSLVLAGGVALNCVANYRILKESGFDNIWVQPAANDAGGALGAALYAAHSLYGDPRSHLTAKSEPGTNDGMGSALLGPAFTNDQARLSLVKLGAHFDEYAEPELLTRTAQLLADGRIIGWFQGRMEFGPRALGNRSILADARDPNMKNRVNAGIKYREAFRPLAPVVLSEEADKWFHMDRASPYMTITFPVRENRALTGNNLPSSTHVDGTSRVQTVSRSDNPLLYQLLQAFREQSGCPALINTSFNVRGEPVVCTPEDAYRCFMKTDIDYLVIGNLLLSKESQPAWTDDEEKHHALD